MRLMMKSQMSLDLFIFLLVSCVLFYFSTKIELGLD